MDPAPFAPAKATPLNADALLSLQKFKLNDVLVLLPRSLLPLPFFRERSSRDWPLLKEDLRLSVSFSTAKSPLY